MLVPIFDAYEHLRKYNDSVTHMRHVVSDWPSIDRIPYVPEYTYMKENTQSDKRKKSSLSIDDIQFNVPFVTVVWSDGTHTGAVDDRLLPYRKTLKVSEKDNSIVFTAGEAKLRMDYKRWKTNFLTQAIVKKLVPDYFDILDKWI